MGNEYQAGRAVHGFRITSVQKDDELQGTVVRMRHERTGAELFWLDNGSENMVFSISFRTLPRDSTGVFHILEHSVLCGSRKYQVREPFVELLKSSMNTFLNAMTFPDMTMFPVSSRNFMDLMNLTRVYLDAVFHPTAMTDRKRFCQEGWHIDRDEDGRPEFRGVVLNEMKGELSDPDMLMDRQIIRQLFPDTPYGHNSGGDPERITDLSWEAFQQSYRECYHPSNAYIYLDGAVDADIMLKAIDESFAGFERRETRPEFVYQTPVSSEETIQYELDRGEDARNRSHLTIARITGSWTDRPENLARSIICDVLTGNNEAPLKRTALEKGLCQDLNMSVDDTGLQSWISVHADNVTDGKEDQIIGLLDETGRRIRKEGIDRDAAEASINRLVFSIREEDEPQGINRCIRCMGTWLYGGDPADALHTRDLIADVRKMLADGRMDGLAADMLLNRENAVILHTRPSYSAGEENRSAEEDRLRRMMAGWTEKDRRDNDHLIEELKDWQETPDDPEKLKQLPVLKRRDADVVPQWTETEKEEMDGVQILHHRIACNGIVYLRAYFPLTGFSLDELTRISLFAGMLGRLPTAAHDAFSLQQEIRKNTGGVSFAVVTRSRDRDDFRCMPYLTAYVSALEEKSGEAWRLLTEILTQTRIRGQEERIREIMKQNEMSARQKIVNAGHLIAVRNVLSAYGAENAIRNATEGEPAIRYIHRFSLHPEAETAGFLQTAGDMLNRAIQRNGMVFSKTGICKDPDPRAVLEAFPAGGEAPETMVYQTSGTPGVGFRIPAQIGFTARGYRLSLCGEEFSGIKWLAGSILSLDYLWNRIRVRGGSYGAGFQVDRRGNIYSYSFLDPTPDKTLAADRDAAGFLRKFAAQEENLDKYIISSLNELNPLLSPRERGAVADARHMSGISREETERTRLEILNARGRDLAACGEWLEAFAERGSICIAAPQKMLEACGNLEIRDL